jgi:hypothetical protein
MSAVWLETTSGALVRGDTIVWISKAATSLSVQQEGGDAKNTVADLGMGHPDLPQGFGMELAGLLSQFAGQRDPYLIRAVTDNHGWRWEVERIDDSRGPRPE